MARLFILVFVFVFVFAFDTSLFGRIFRSFRGAAAHATQSLDYFIDIKMLSPLCACVLARVLIAVNLSSLSLSIACHPLVVIIVLARAFFSNCKQRAGLTAHLSCRPLANWIELSRVIVIVLQLFPLLAHPPGPSQGKGCLNKPAQVLLANSTLSLTFPLNRRACCKLCARCCAMIMPAHSLSHPR